MNLIEQLGGYEEARKQGEEWGFDDHLSNALLEYRRANNIFEMGDKIVYRSLPHQRVFCVKHILEDLISIVVHECWDEAGAKCFSEFPPFSDIRHATDEEIAAGHRL